MGITSSILRTDASLLSRDGGTIVTRTTLPTLAAGGKPSAVVVFQMGTRSPATLFDGMAKELAEQGMASVAVGTRFNGADHAVYADDLQRVVEQARDQFPDVPIAVGGTSAGASIALQWASHHNVDGLPVVALAPVVLPRFLGPSDLAKVAVSMVRRDATAGMHVSTPMTRHVPLTTNPQSMETEANVIRAGVDPATETVPPAFFGDLSKMAIDTSAHRSAMRGPLLLAFAKRDPVQVTVASRAWSHTVTGSSVDRLKFRGTGHDISQAFDHPRVAEQIGAWIRRTPATPPAVA